MATFAVTPRHPRLPVGQTAYFLPSEESSGHRLRGSILGVGRVAQELPGDAARLAVQRPEGLLEVGRIVHHLNYRLRKIEW